MVDLTPEQVCMLEELVEKYRKLQEYKSKIDGTLRELRVEIIRLLQQPDIKLRVGRYLVYYTKYKQKRLDTRKLREFLGKEYDSFTYEAEVTKLIISESDKG